MKDKENSKIFLENKKIKHKFQIVDTLEAGIVLLGHEVKSIREGSANFEGSFIKIINGELWLLNLYIAPYKLLTSIKVDPRRKRKLLVHKREILKIQNLVKQKGLIIVPLSLYFNPQEKIKAKIGMAKPLKIYEQKKKIIKKIQDRELKRFAK